MSWRDIERELALQEGRRPPGRSAEEVFGDVGDEEFVARLTTAGFAKIDRRLAEADGRRPQAPDPIEAALYGGGR